MFNSKPNDLIGTNVDKTHESRWYLSLTILRSTNAISVFSRCGTFSPFLCTVIFSSVLPGNLLPGNLIVSGAKSSR